MKNYLEKHGYVEDPSAKKYYDSDVEMIWKSRDRRITITKYSEESSTNSGKLWEVHVDNDHFESIGWLEFNTPEVLSQFLKLCDYYE